MFTVRATIGANHSIRKRTAHATSSYTLTIPDGDHINSTVSYFADDNPDAFTSVSIADYDLIEVLNEVGNVVDFIGDPHFRSDETNESMKAAGYTRKRVERAA